MPKLRGRLFLKYAGLFVAVVSLALLTNGLFEIWFSYQEHKASLARIQKVQAESAAEKIAQFIKEIENQIGWTTQMHWSGETVEQHRLDALRLLRQVPAITELVEVDGTGKEQLRVSRVAMDVVGSGLDMSKDPKFVEAVKAKSYYGPVYFRRESEPYMTLALAGTRRHAGVSIAEVNLKFIWDVVSRIKVGERGLAYVIDRKGRLIAHPDISLVLRNTDMTHLAQVRSARQGSAQSSDEDGQVVHDVRGRPVLAAYARVDPPGWLVFVELPLEEANAPLFSSLKRSSLVLAAALCLAALAGIFLARRMVVPVQALRTGAARIGSGDLAQRISVKTGDELETLADQFNDMAGRLQASYADLEKKVELRTRELSEALQRQTATSEVLQIISSSRGDLQPVFKAMLENATRICEARFGMLWLHENGGFRSVATLNVPPALAEMRQRDAIIHPDSSIPLGRVLHSKRLEHIADITAEPGYGSGFPPLVALADLGGARTLVVVPMLRETELVGAIAIYRQEVRPFTEEQIDLVQNFAAQVVIAIENARLLNELQQRTHDLSKSLEDLRTTQDRLVHTEKLASLGQLTAGIAHEIKNPLNFVNNFSGVSAELINELQEALHDVRIDEKKRAEIDELANTLQGNLGKIVQHGKRADAIVKNMLLHSRQGSDQHRRVDINSLVDESLNLAYHGARADKQGFNITLERFLDPAAGEVDVFPQDISRVLLNLIANGFYAATRRKTQSDGGAFEPTLSASTRDLGDRVEIRIRDNGTGIPPEVKEKMFNPFFTTKPAGEGTGLGLSISHDIIVKQHGGSIEVDSQSGQFTEIKITLPRSGVFPAESAAHA